MPDGGQVSLDWTPPLAQKPIDNTPTLVLLHGLTGGSHESYIRGLLEVVTRPPFNYRGVVFNARGCANTELTTPQLFNGAYTEDLRRVLKHIVNVLPEGTPLIGIGYSLGSNILVKVSLHSKLHTVGSWTVNAVSRRRR
jgi:predicted alpha/beta-fold hydrolase